MTQISPETCLSAETLRQLAHDELTPAELMGVEEHVGSCDQCRLLLEVSSSDERWTHEIEPVLRERDEHLQPDGEFDDSLIDGARADSILRLLGPTDDPHMLGRIGPYEVVSVIGRGGMGVVFKAFDAGLNRFVAIKMLLPHLAESGAARKRFAREGQAAAAVIDDHVVPIYSVADWQGVPYIVTQYLRGSTLQKRIQERGSLELKEVLRIGLQTARGLAAANAQGLVHRDVKPSNILLDGTVERAMLTDFGLARAIDDASITRTGVITGTPQYMSPEQANGEPIDHRSDLFSLGGVMYTMCTGRPPFRADTTFGVLRRIRETAPRSICEINPEIPAWLEQIVFKLLEKDAVNRFNTPTELADLLQHCLAHVQHPTTVPLPDVCQHPSMRFNWQLKILSRKSSRVGIVLLLIVCLAAPLQFVLRPSGRPIIVTPSEQSQVPQMAPAGKRNPIPEQRKQATAEVPFAWDAVEFELNMAIDQISTLERSAALDLAPDQNNDESFIPHQQVKE